MFEYSIDVNGVMLRGKIIKDENRTYVFKCLDIKYAGYASELRALAIEIEQVAAELDKLNGRSKNIR